MKFKKILPYLVAVLILVFFELLFYYYQSWVWWLLAINIIVIASVLILNNFHVSKDSFGFMTAPLVLCNASFIFLLLQESSVVKQIVIAIACFFTWLFINNLSVFFYNYKAYLIYSLENISHFINLLSSFFIYTSVFAFYVLSVTRLRWLIASLFLITAILAWQTLWINKISKMRMRYLPWLMALIIVELFWVCHYWPTGFYVNGLILVVIYYVMINLSRLYFLDTLNKKYILKYLISSSLIIFLILLTAQWT